MDGCAELRTGQWVSLANALFPKGYTCAGSKQTLDTLKKLVVDAGAQQTRVLKSQGAFFAELGLEPGSKMGG